MAHIPQCARMWTTVGTTVGHGTAGQHPMSLARCPTVSTFQHDNHIFQSFPHQPKQTTTTCTLRLPRNTQPSQKHFVHHTKPSPRYLARIPILTHDDNLLRPHTYSPSHRHCNTTTSTYRTPNLHLTIHNSNLTLTQTLPQPTQP